MALAWEKKKSLGSSGPSRKSPESRGGADLEISRLGVGIGVEIRGVELGEPLDDRIVGLLQQTLRDYQVLSFPEQSLDPERILGLARLFGKPEVHPIHSGMPGNPEIMRIDQRQGEPDLVGDRARTMTSHFARPSKIVLCYCDRVSANCDFLFASLTRAWDGLSLPVQDFLLNLKAIHSGEREFAPPSRDADFFVGRLSSQLIYSDAIYACTEHPLVHTHPDTGKRSLYVNETFTLGISGLSDVESNAILKFLFRHTALPEYGCRVPAEPGTLMIFDNRVTTQSSTSYSKCQSRLLYVVPVASEEDLQQSASWPPRVALSN